MRILGIEVKGLKPEKPKEKPSELGVGSVMPGNLIIKELIKSRVDSLIDKKK